MATGDKLAALPQASAPSRVQLIGIRPAYVLVLKFDEPIELAKGKPLRTLRDVLANMSLRSQRPTRRPRAPDSRLLKPRETWSDKQQFDITVHKLVQMFRENFAKFENAVDEEVRAAAPMTQHRPTT